jgi:phosphoglycolate phosphatase
VKSIFFDLDGTLSDPKVGITKSIQYALERLDVPVPTTGKLLWCIGPPLRASFKHLLDEARADEAVALYRERFGDVGLFENDLYDGVPTTLDALQNSGIRLFMATSKPHFICQTYR